MVDTFIARANTISTGGDGPLTVCLFNGFSCYPFSDGMPYLRFWRSKSLEHKLTGTQGFYFKSDQKYIDEIVEPSLKLADDETFFIVVNITDLVYKPAGLFTWFYTAVPVEKYPGVLSSLVAYYQTIKGLTTIGLPVIMICRNEEIAPECIEFVRKQLIDGGLPSECVLYGDTTDEKFSAMDVIFAL